MKRFLNKKTYQFIGAFCVTAFLLFLPLITHAVLIDDVDVGPVTSFNETTKPAAQGTTNPDSGLSWIGSAFKSLTALVGNLVLTISSWLLWASGVLLVQVLDFTLVNMSTNLNSIAGINIAWTVFRDLANMFFIFILLYAAISQILQLGSPKKIITNVVIIAILINFSLFFTKMIIDASNIVTIGFYNQIAQSAGTSGTESNGLAGPFIKQMGLTSIWSLDAGGNGGALSTEDPFTQIFFTGIMGSVFLIVAAFVFFAANLMFIKRFVTLMFLLILSPIAYVMTLIPAGKSISKKWWGALFDNVLFAPAYMIMLYASLLVLEGVIKTPGDLGAALKVGGTQTGGALGAVMNFVIAIAMLIFCLIAASTFGAKGADQTQKKLKDLGVWAGGKLGRGAMRAAGAQKLDQMLEESKFGNTRLGSIVRSATTEKLTKMKVGDRSIKDVDKEYKELDKKRGEFHIKAEEKKFEDGLQALRTQELLSKNYLESKDEEKAREKLAAEQTERERAIENLKKTNAPKMVELEGEVSTLEAQLNNMAPDRNVFANTASVSEKQEFKKIQDQIDQKKKSIGELSTKLSPEVQQKIEELKTKLESTKKEIETKSKEQDIKTKLHNIELAAINKKPKASEKEREKWLNPELERVADELEMGDSLGKVVRKMGKLGLPYLHGNLGLNERKDAAKEIRKKAKTSFKRKEILQEFSRAIKSEGDEEKNAILKRILEKKGEDISGNANEEEKPSETEEKK